MKNFSFIITFHNEEAKLRDTLKSIFNLFYFKDKMEVICVDDGSTDKSSEIAKSFPTRYVRTPHLGISNARNIGFVKSIGKYVVFLDAHLVLKNKNTLRIFEQYFKKYPKVAAICGKYKSVNTHDWNFVRDLRRIALFHKNNRNRFISLSKFTTLSLAICAFRRSILLTYKFPKEFINSYGEDTYLQLQMHKNNLIFFYTPHIVGLHDANLTFRKILYKMLFEIHACFNILLHIDGSIKVPYLHYFLSYPLLLCISIFLFLIHHAFFPLLIFTVTVECMGALGVFFVKNYPLSKKLITYFYVISKEFIQGIYLPLYVLFGIRSFKQFKKIIQILIFWELKKYSMSNLLGYVRNFNKQ